MLTIDFVFYLQKSIYKVNCIIFYIDVILPGRFGKFSFISGKVEKLYQPGALLDSQNLKKLSHYFGDSLFLTSDPDFWAHLFIY